MLAAHVTQAILLAGLDREVLDRCLVSLDPKPLRADAPSQHTGARR
jgi:hypothetical protein